MSSQMKVKYSALFLTAKYLAHLFFTPNIGLRIYLSEKIENSEIFSILAVSDCVL